MSFFFFWKVQDLMLDDCGQKNIRAYTNIHMRWSTRVSGFSRGGSFSRNPGGVISSDRKLSRSFQMQGVLCDRPGSHA